jgi:hypothetical protein
VTVPLAAANTGMQPLEKAFMFTPAARTVPPLQLVPPARFAVVALVGRNG